MLIARKDLFLLSIKAFYFKLDKNLDIILQACCNKSMVFQEIQGLCIQGEKQITPIFVLFHLLCASLSRFSDVFLIPVETVFSPMFLLYWDIL